MATNYNPPKISITIANGQTNSGSFQIVDIDKAAIVAPATLTGTTTLQVSFDNGATWRNPSNTAITMTQGQVVDAGIMATICPFFQSDVRFRLSNSQAVSADRVFIIYGIK